jgi:hypothetical protein
MFRMALPTSFARRRALHPKTPKARQKRLYGTSKRLLTPTPMCLANALMAWMQIALMLQSTSTRLSME